MPKPKYAIGSILVILLALSWMTACGGGGGGGGGGDDITSVPVADVSLVNPTDAFVGDAISLDGSNSSDPDGSIVSYEWDLGNGSTVSGVDQSYSYASAGTYTITLTVTDDAGNTDSASVEVTIQDGTPEADAGGPYGPVLVGASVSFDGSASGDTDGTDGGETPSYAWEFGDGATATGVSPSHSYSSPSTPGTYPVTLTYTDDDGQTDSDTAEVRVHQAPLADAGSDQSAEEGGTVNFDASASSDPDSDGSIASYEWDWDDSGSYDDATGATVSHSWGTDGTYTVGLRVTDNDGATDTDTVEVTVVNPGDNLPPTADAGGPYGPVLSGNIPMSLDGSGSSDSDGSISSYSWDFDYDGTTHSEDATGENPSFTNSAVGDYTIHLNVTDNESATSADTSSIRVHAEPTADINDSGNPEYVLNGREFTLSASDSQPDGGAAGGPVDNIAEYRWDFDNDGTADTTTSVPTVDHSYSTDGDHVVALEVLDSSGVLSPAQDTYTVKVHRKVNAAIDVSVSGSGSLKNGVWVILYGDTVTFDGSSSSDPDSVYNNVSDLVDADYEWDNNYGGTFDSSTTGASFSRTPSSENDLPSGITEGQVQTMALRLADPDDSAVTDIATIDFRVNAPPEASFSHDPKDQYQGDTTTYDALVGETITFDASGSSDIDGTVETYSWDFGDGSTNDVSGNGINHSYSTAGEYTVELTVTDNDGDLSTAVTATVHIANEGDVDVTVE